MGNPRFVLNDLDEDGVYSGSFSGFSCSGDYIVTFFAQDYQKNMAVSTAVVVSVTGAEDCKPDEPVDEFDVTTGVYTAKEVYHYGDTIEVQVKSKGTGFYDQYTALALPDGLMIFMTETNKFVMDMQPWSVSPVLNDSPVTVLLLPLFFDLPQGTYWVYNLLVPQGLDPFSYLDEWVLGAVSFEVK